MHNARSRPDSERVVLGALLMDGIQAMEHCLRLQPEMFALSSHRTLFGAMQGKHVAGEDWNEVSLSEHLRERGLYEQVCGNHGFAYLQGLVEATPFRQYNPSEHVGRIVEAWKVRRTALLGEDIGKRLDEGESADDTLGWLEARAMEITAEAQEIDDPHVMEHSVREYEQFLRAANSEEVSRGLSFGNDSLDRWTHGMQPGEVTVVGARSGVGKSSLMCQTIAANCPSGIPVDCFSLEMARARVLRRLWAVDSGVEYRKVHRPYKTSVAERQQVKDAAFRIAEWPLRVYEDAGMGIDQIIARARMSVRRYGTQLMCVDYLQIVAGEGKDDRTRVAGVISKLRRFAKDTGCHVMALSQLAKVERKYYTHPPTANDLRETGQIENDAHTIVLLHRAWNEERLQLEDEASLIIPKCRDGKTGAMESKFNEKDLTFA